MAIPKQVSHFIVQGHVSESIAEIKNSKPVFTERLQGIM